MATTKAGGTKTTAKRKASGTIKKAASGAANKPATAAAGKAGVVGATDGGVNIAALVFELASESAGTVSRAVTRLRNNVTAKQLTDLIEALARLDDTTELQASAAQVADGVEIPAGGDAARHQLLPFLHTKIERGSAVVVTAALVLLGRLAEQESMYPIVRVLQDKQRRTSLSAWDVEKHLRMAAARAIGLIGNREAAVYLIEALTDPTGDVVIEVCNALQKIGDNRAVPNLQEILRKAAREELKQKLIETINVLRLRRGIR